jgi:hypothetical protein
VYPNVRTSRIGIDATVDFKGFEFGPLVRPGTDAIKRVMDRWQELGLPDPA